MKKLKIKEVIVVEGIHDMQKIQSCVEADVIVSGGTHLSQKFLETCDKLNKRQGIIVFSDPDGPGEMIRTKIIEKVGTCKHASLSLIQSKQKNKVGIEHASCDDILGALKQVATFDTQKQSLDYDDFLDLGLNGRPDSQQKRDFISAHYHIPRMNGKRCFKYLNMLGVQYETLVDLLKEY